MRQLSENIRNTLSNVLFSFDILNYTISISKNPTSSKLNRDNEMEVSKKPKNAKEELGIIQYNDLKKIKNRYSGKTSGYRVVKVTQDELEKLTDDSGIWGG